MIGLICLLVLGVKQCGKKDTTGISSSVAAATTSQISTEQLERTLALTAVDVHKGSLILVNADHVYTFAADDVSLETVYEGRNSCYGVSDMEVSLDTDVIDHFNQLMQAYYNIYDNNDIMIVSGYRTREEQAAYYESKKTMLPGGYSDYHTARSFDLVVYPNGTTSNYYAATGDYAWIAEHAAEYGLVYRSRPPYEVLKTNWLKFGEILRIRQVEEMLEVYYNSGQYATAIRLLETQYASAFAMFAELGTFYEEHGYFGMGHSRMRRAEILLEFAKERKPGLLPVLGEGLVYDLYERENLGSRPSWAADANEWKQIACRYGKKGKQSHIERFFYRFSGHRQDTASLPERLEEPVYVRFDYTGRDPLDHQARHEYLEPSGE